MLQVRVKDQGIGIEKEKQPNVFLLKTRSMQGTLKEKGSGLGLTLCKDWRHYIWVESETGNGSTFCFTLVCC
jgi:signal transduction histidine kinase